MHIGILIQKKICLEFLLDYETEGRTYTKIQTPKQNSLKHYGLLLIYSCLRELNYVTTVNYFDCTKN